MANSSDPQVAPAASAAAAAFSLDVDGLLRPVAVDQPAGSDLRYEGTFDAIREARRADDPTLPQGVWVTDLKRANWRDVGRLCTTALTEKSKDLQIAAWLAEALVQEKGFAGAREGLRLVRALCEAFWDDLHPTIAADGDVEPRLAPMVWLNERLPQLLRQLPLTQAETGEDRPFTWDDWENTARLEALGQRDRAARDRAEASGKPSRAKFLTAVTLTPASFYRDMVAVSRDCLTILAELGALLDEKCGAEAPSFAAIRSILDDIQSLAADTYRDKGGAETDLGDAETALAAAPTIAPVATGMPLQAIRTRDEAYRMLSLAAEYLMKTEPHSPSPYLVRRAVSWGSMSLDELLRELVANEHDLGQLFSLLGMAKMPAKK